MFQPPKRSIWEISYRVGAVTAFVFCLFAVTCLFLSSNSWGLVAFLALLTAALFAASCFFEKKVQQLSQKRRDDFAFIIFEQSRARNISKFALFLRPFYVTGKLKIDVLIYTGGQPGSPTYQTFTYHLEETIIAAFKKVMPIVALGKPGEVQGVGRILMDGSTWKPAASELMRHASLIICIPSSHPELYGNWMKSSVTIIYPKLCF